MKLTSMLFTSMRGGLVLCAWLALSAGALGAETLSYRLTGLDKPLRRNVEAWLGTAPQSEAERASFLVAARERVEEGLQALGYYHPEIDFELDRQAVPWRLEIRVDAGEPVRIARFDVQVIGEAADDPAFDQLLEGLPLKAGDILHHGQYEAMKTSLLSLGQRRGYFDARIETGRVAVEAAANRAELQLHYNSGQRYRFGALRYDEQSLFTEQLEALQPFRRGDPFQLASLQEFQSQLQRTGYFSGVLVQPRLDEADNGEVPLDLELFPAKRHSFEVGVGYSTDTEERVSMVWRTPRINRHGHSQETRLEYSVINPSGKVTYNIPLTHPLDDVLQLRARLEQNEFGDLESDQQEVGVRRELRRNGYVYGFSLRALNEAWGPQSSVLEERNRPGSRDREDTYLLPGFSVSHKSRQGSLVNPRAGLSQYYQVEGASEQAGSDASLLRVYAKLVGVTSMAERHRFVGRVEAGAVYMSGSQRDALAPSLNFFAGGSQSLRGYDYQSIGHEVTVTRPNGESRTLVVGGDRLLLGSLEYQYRFLDNWRGAVFVDAGDAFDDGHFKANYGVGVGLHYLTPVGAVKLEVANSVSEDDPSWMLHINIGAEF
ncbi:autotransporter assembly complex protein TamA [Parahaliea mediterranea]|uniref:Translocation and assembly module subunit TamA n=1 Tax=Parahaliea mediterranea TaxID=651086 RepID=A0A939DIA5_9GAMM|nr:autotransporter assembly complex family protein [Parahaliea mediterranea]MBN7798640.1 outer membrane protein assembly factor [Parahaliea mediterranea]